MCLQADELLGDGSCTVVSTIHLSGRKSQLIQRQRTMDLKSLGKTTHAQSYGDDCRAIYLSSLLLVRRIVYSSLSKYNCRVWTSQIAGLDTRIQTDRDAVIILLSCPTGHPIVPAVHHCFAQHVLCIGYMCKVGQPFYKNAPLSL